MNAHEYLLSYGVRGDFGRFHAAEPLSLRRGDRAVVRTVRGLELAEVLRPAAPGLATFLPNTSVGTLLRAASVEDLAAAQLRRHRSLQLTESAVSLARSLDLPMEVLDAELLFDGQRGIVHMIHWAECDVRPFVSGLSRDFDLQIELADLSTPQSEPEPEHGHDHGSCGSCGSGGGCGSCGSGGGGCGTCGSAEPLAVASYFAEMREKFERRHALL